MSPIPSDENQTFHDLVVASGRDPAGFTVELHPDGHMRVMGPRGVAFYPQDQWLGRFSRHLEKGFFDAVKCERHSSLLQSNSH